MKYLKIYLQVLIFISVSFNTENTFSFDFFLQTVDSNAKYTIFDIDCADSANCISLSRKNGQYHRIRHTTDRGLTWFDSFIQPDTGKFPMDLYDISYPDNDFAYVSCDSGIILKTSNNGKEWERIFIDSNKALNKIFMLDRALGYSLSNYGKSLYKTKDGWKTHNIISLPDSFLLGRTDMQIFDEGIIYIYSPIIEGGNIFITYNDGISWSVRKTPKLAYWIKTYFYNRQIGWALGAISFGSKNYYYIYKTEDSGQTWKLQSEILNQRNYNDICFTDSLNGVIVGNFELIMLTTDGGNSWKENEIPKYANPLSYNRIVFPSKSSAFITANLGVIKKWDKSLTSIFSSSEAKNLKPIIYPNPVQSGDEINIDIAGFEHGNSSFFICDILGKQLTTADYQYLSIDTKTITFTFARNVKPGVYLINLTIHKKRFNEILVVY
ncbi:MAG: YCF48-related protein [Candidatus Kapabacteria bacterium]|nr:YCF48-related protein [Candidatus Kapabacteria bacterium]